MTRTADSETHYQTLKIVPSAAQTEIKAAYRRLLLSSHPDKKNSRSSPTTFDVEPSEQFDIARIQGAYRILSDLNARAAYDTSLNRHPIAIDTRTSSSHPRPAQVVSLEELSSVSVESNNGMPVKWSHACRCGGTYYITEKDMEDDQHLIACDQCSEVIYVGYEVMVESEEEP